MAAARAVKARQRRRGRDHPVVWLFTDAACPADPAAVAASLAGGPFRRLAPGLAGVVFRHDAAPARVAIGARLAAVCRARRLALVVAGDPRLAARLGAGLHLRGGRRCLPGAVLRRGAWRTASAHSVAELRLARRSGARLVFLSPAFATASHPDAPGLGALRWSALAGTSPGMVALALGGIDGRSVRRLAGRAAGYAAIRALYPGGHSCAATPAKLSPGVAAGGARPA